VGEGKGERADSHTPTLPASVPAEASTSDSSAASSPAPAKPTPTPTPTTSSSSSWFEWLSRCFCFGGGETLAFPPSAPRVEASTPLPSRMGTGEASGSCPAPPLPSAKPSPASSPPLGPSPSWGGCLGECWGSTSGGGGAFAPRPPTGAAPEANVPHSLPRRTGKTSTQRVPTSSAASPPIYGPRSLRESLPELFSKIEENDLQFRHCMLRETELLKESSGLQLNVENAAAILAEVSAAATVAAEAAAAEAGPPRPGPPEPSFLHSSFWGILRGVFSAPLLSAPPPLQPSRLPAKEAFEVAKAKLAFCQRLLSRHRLIADKSAGLAANARSATALAAAALQLSFTITACSVCSQLQGATALLASITTPPFGEEQLLGNHAALAQVEALRDAAKCLAFFDLCKFGEGTAAVPHTVQAALAQCTAACDSAHVACVAALELFSSWATPPPRVQQAPGHNERNFVRLSRCCRRRTRPWQRSRRTRRRVFFSNRPVWFAYLEFLRHFLNSSMPAPWLGRSLLFLNNMS